MEGGTGIKVLWYCELNLTHTALRVCIWPIATCKEMFDSSVHPIKPGGDNGTKRPNHVRQKQHRAEPVLALSSAFVTRDP